MGTLVSNLIVYSEHSQNTYLIITKHYFALGVVMLPAVTIYYKGNTENRNPMKKLAIKTEKE